MQCDRYALLTGCAGATKAEGENAHGNDTAAFSAVDVGVIGEDVGDRLGSVRLESHCVGIYRCVSKGDCRLSDLGCMIICRCIGKMVIDVPRSRQWVEGRACGRLEVTSYARNRSPDLRW